MVRVKEDMTGWIMSEHGFPNSRIIVIKQADDYISPQGLHYAKWWCKCKCGNPEQFVVKSLELRNGDTQSCGCLREESSIKRLKKENKVDLNLKDEYGLYGVGYCTNTGSKFYFDMEDYDKIKDYTWYETVHQDGYHSLDAWESKKHRQIRMHQLIVGRYYDYKDRNPLNNRKYNLRKATAAENNRNKDKMKTNTSGFIGVAWDKDSSKWCAYITVDYKQIKLGRFIDKEDAIIARLKAEREYYGEFAPQRHLFEEYGIEDNMI